MNQTIKRNYNAVQLEGGTEQAGWMKRMMPQVIPDNEKELFRQRGGQGRREGLFSGQSGVSIVCMHPAEGGRALCTLA
jgi:hypothetical protein